VGLEIGCLAAPIITTPLRTLQRLFLAGTFERSRMKVPTLNRRSPHKTKGDHKPTTIAQSAIQAAARLDRQADLWLAVGRVAQAERLADLAYDLRIGGPA
jgi:hypothetical protein